MAELADLAEPLTARTRKYQVVPEARPLIVALVAFIAAVVVTRPVVNVELVARSISKPASFAELSDQVSLICEEPGAEALEPALPFPHQAGGVGNVITFAVADNHFVNYGKRVLQVGVEHDNCIARSKVETGGTSELVPKISREVDDFDPRVFLGPVRDLLNR